MHQPLRLRGQERAGDLRGGNISGARAAAELGWEPRFSNAETLCATYDWYLAHLAEMRSAGTTHRVPWDQQALGILKRLS